MGSTCSKYSQDEMIPEREDLVDLIAFHPEIEFPLKYFSVCNNFEEKVNLLKVFPLLDFMVILNNLNYGVVNEILHPKLNDLTEEEREEEINMIVIKMKNFVYHKNIVTRENFIEDMIMNKIINSYVYSDLRDNYKKDELKVFMVKLFDFMHRFCKKRNPEYDLGLTKYTASIFGLHFCESRISQKINVILNIICGPDGKITIQKPEEGEYNSFKITRNFILQYILFAILPTLNILMEKQAKTNDEKKMEELVGKKEFVILKEKFSDFRKEPDYEFEPHVKVVFGTNEGKDFNIRQELTNFINVYVFNLIFGKENIKKALSREQFRNFLLDRTDQGGFWLLFKQGIRNKFEMFLREHQNKIEH